MKTLALAILATVGATPAFAQSSGQLSPDYARLVPKESVLFVRLSSVEELLPPVERMRAVFAPEGKAWTTADLLAALEIPADPTLIDTKVALGFALAVSREKPIPTPVFIVGTTDPAAFVASLQPPWRDKAITSGACVGIALEGTYSAQEESKALLRDLPTGLVVVRIDIQRLIEAFRPLIDLGLIQAESMLDSPQGAAPLDIRNFMQSIFDLAVDFLDSADRLDLVLDVQGAKAKLSGVLATLEGSALSEWGRPEEIDYPGLAGRLDPEAPVQFASTFDTSGYTAQILELYGAMLEYAAAGGHVPPAFLDAGRAAIQALKEVQCHVGTSALSSFGLGAWGFRGAFLYSSPDPKSLVRSLDGLLELPALAQVGIRTGEPLQLEIGGIEVTRRVARFDLDSFLNLLPESERPKSEEIEAVRRVIKELLPGGLQLALGSVASESGEGWAVCVLGGDETYLRGTLERSCRSASAVSDALAPALSGLKGANPGAFFRYDVARLLHGFEGFAAALSVDSGSADASALAAKFAGLSLSLVGWTGIEGRIWRGGVALDLDELGQFVQSLAD